MEGEQVPMKVEKKTYKVTGPSSFRGHAPGEEFEAGLLPDQERRAIERGSIRVVNKRETKGKDNA